jgi:hypothetical protein
MWRRPRRSHASRRAGQVEMPAHRRVPRAGQMRSIGSSARVKTRRSAATARKVKILAWPGGWGMHEVFLGSFRAPPARLDSPCTHAAARWPPLDVWTASIGPSASSPGVARDATRHAYRPSPTQGADLVAVAVALPSKGSAVSDVT